jgi:hypothetical protein
MAGSSLTIPEPLAVILQHLVVGAVLCHINSVQRQLDLLVIRDGLTDQPIHLLWGVFFDRIEQSKNGKRCPGVPVGTDRAGQLALHGEGQVSSQVIMEPAECLQPDARETVAGATQDGPQAFLEVVGFRVLVFLLGHGQFSR